MYAIFSGERGSKVAACAMDKMAADILFGGLTGPASDEDVKEMLRQSFISAEKTYMNSVDNLLAQKTNLQYNIPDGISQYEITQKYQDTLDKLRTINEELEIAASAVLVLIYYSKLFVCNIGNCRALLCKNDSNDVLRCVQLSVDHNLQNEEEVLRLCQLGLDIQLLKTSPLESTRCLGNYLGKAGYKESEYLSAATSEPIIFQPEIIGGIPIDGSCRFLLILSGGLCKTLEDIFPSSEVSQANKEIVQMTVEQFRSQSTLMGVAQSVVNKVIQMHHDTYMQQIQESNFCPFKSHQDVTLLVRNFNFPLPNALQKRISFNPVVREHDDFVQFTQSEINSIFDTTSNISTNDSSSSELTETESYQSDRDKKIQSYVDFSEYFKRVDDAKKNNCLPAGIEFD